MLGALIRGWLGEKTTTFGMWLFLDPNTYRRVDNVIVPARDGTTQIDHVLVSVFGLFVIETKNMTGWIFGSPETRTWTQCIYGRKYHFQNPLNQNYRHTRCLAEYLNINHALMHSVVFFIGECEFKTPMPGNVLNKGLAAYIKSFRTPCLTPTDVADIEAKLRALKQDPSLTRSAHLKSLRERHGSSGYEADVARRRKAGRGPDVAPNAYELNGFYWNGSRIVQGLPLEKDPKTGKYRLHDPATPKAADTAAQVTNLEHRVQELERALQQSPARDTKPTSTRSP